MSSQWVYNASPEINNESNYPVILGVTISLSALMVFVVLLRLYVRGHMLKFVGADDWVIVASAICSVTYCGLTITQTRYGLGLPLADRPKANLDTYSSVNFGGRPFYMMGILGFKVALCLGYLRILSQGQKAYRMLVWFIMIFCVLAHLIGTLVLILSCTPVRKSWRPKTDGHCLPSGPVFYGLAGTTIGFDIIIFFLPIPLLWTLNMNTRKKYGLMGVFLLGLFTTVCSIMRMAQISIIANGNGNSTALVLWGNVEMNVGIILTCIPVLAPLFKFFNQKFTTYAHGSRNIHESHDLKAFPGSTTNNTFNASSKGKSYGDMSTSNESQETILGKDIGHTRSTSAEHVKNGEILKTIRVDVETSQNRGSNGHGNMKGVEYFA